MQVSSAFSSRRLARNIVWNLLGVCLPLLVALWAIPRLIQGLGAERYGVLAIIWMGIGYFSLFDFGVGRALTKLVAERLGNGQTDTLPVLITTGLRLMFGFGVCGAMVVALLTPWLTGRVLNIPDSLADEATVSLWILAVALPFVVLTAGQIGVLQAYERFAAITVVRIPLGVATFLVPLAALRISPSLVSITLGMAVTRVVAWLIYRLMCQPYVIERPRQVKAFDTAHVRALLSFGGWITLGNVISPLMVYFDRFLIGALLTMTAVTYYTTPYEVITRLWLVAEAVGGCCFRP